MLHPHPSVIPTEGEMGILFVLRLVSRYPPKALCTHVGPFVGGWI